MRKKTSKKKSQEFSETAADRIAAEGRRLASKLSEEEHEDYLHEALLIAYGGRPKEATRTRH